MKKILILVAILLGGVSVQPVESQDQWIGPVHFTTVIVQNLGKSCPNNTAQLIPGEPAVVAVEMVNIGSTAYTFRVYARIVSTDRSLVRDTPDMEISLEGQVKKFINFFLDRPEAEFSGTIQFAAYGPQGYNQTIEIPFLVSSSCQ